VRLIFLLLAVFICIALIEIPKMVRNKHRRELAAFLVFFALAFVLSLLQTAGVKIPSPMKGIEYVVKDILHLGYK
jgi:uncharacterized membrane protein